MNSVLGAEAPCSYTSVGSSSVKKRAGVNRFESSTSCALRSVRINLQL